jgi:hypothetical protein
MTKDELRKHVIKCKTLGEMRAVWNALRGSGENTTRETFSYKRNFNLHYPYKAWIPTADNGSLSAKEALKILKPSEIRIKLPEGYTVDFELNRERLRKQIIGGFNSLEEMREAWGLLRANGEPTFMGAFAYKNIRNFEWCGSDWCSTGDWWSTDHEHTMTLQDLRDFFPNTEPETVTVDHDCSLYWSVTQNCCLKCHPERDPRTNTDLWGVLDTAKREQELIRQVRAGRLNSTK